MLTKGGNGGGEGGGAVRSGRTPPALCLLLLWVRGGVVEEGERVAGEGEARERGTESIVVGLYVAVPNSSAEAVWMALF
jgi:hypothetical protein